MRLSKDDRERLLRDFRARKARRPDKGSDDALEWVLDHYEAIDYVRETSDDDATQSAD